MRPPYRSLWSQLGRLGLVALTLWAIGVTGYVLIGHPLLDALFMTTLVITTAGFTPVAELDGPTKAFTIALAVVGVALFLLVLAVLGAAVTDQERRAFRRRKRMQRRIDGLRDHFVVCAYGRVGRAIVRELEAEGVPFVVIDAKAELEPRLQADGVLYLIGEPSSEAILRQAGLDRARALVCAVDDDATNVYITLGARSLNPRLFIVGRAGDARAAERLRRAGANRVVSPYAESGRHMALMALRPRVLDFLELAARGGESVRVNEVFVEEDGDLSGASVREAAGGAIALLLRRPDGEILVQPSEDETLRPGDVVLTFGDSARPPATSGADAR